ncbi:hypothetical protein ACE38V_12800 [Cytobacillus sp. Hz8]|uniref:hypothetical protein n=1 Tax=Cytobacillus sp. Hz8 TaxID=3347168 RepID=UPI0035D874E3
MKFTTTLTKVCTNCGIEKEVSEKYFARDKRSKYGFKSTCKECNKIYRKQHYQDHKKDIREKQNKYLHQYYQEHREKILEYKKQHYLIKKGESNLF